MTDELTEVLHAGTEHVPTALRRPADVRRSAEHRRLVRRAVGGAVAAVVVLAVAIGSGLGGDAAPTPRPSPAETPTTPQPSLTNAGGLFTLAAHPLLTEAEWQSITGGPGTRTAIDPNQLHACTPDPRVQGEQTDSRAGTYREQGRPGTRINEFAMRYADEAGAIQAYADVYKRFVGCRDPAYVDNAYYQWSPPQGLGYLADEQFTAELLLKSAEGPDYGSGPFAYQLIAARDRNVVIVIESTGWGERTLHTVQMALMRAIPSERGRCAPFCD